MTRFSIIATDYEPHVPRDRMLQGLRSLQNQTFKDFELIIIHDGPKPTSSDEYSEAIFDYKYIETKKHYGIYDTEKLHGGYGWGHHSRDLGIHMANGEYIINFNIDNILYPYALDYINEKIELGKSEVIIFPCIHHKFNVSYFSGLPPVMGKIDMLQCVASKKAWDNIGGWYRYDHSADGYLIEHLVKLYGYSYINEVLGENR